MHVGASFGDTWEPEPYNIFSFPILRTVFVFPIAYSDKEALEEGKCVGDIRFRRVYQARCTEELTSNRSGMRRVSMIRFKEVASCKIE